MKTTRKKLAVLSLLIAVVLAVGTMHVQVERETGCFSQSAPPDCTEIVHFGGVPISVFGREDINSPANRSNFDDGFNALALIGNFGIYYILVLSLLVMVKD